MSRSRVGFLQTWNIHLFDVLRNPSQSSSSQQGQIPSAWLLGERSYRGTEGKGIIHLLSLYFSITCDSEFVPSTMDRGAKLHRANLTAWVTSGIFDDLLDQITLMGGGISNRLQWSAYQSLDPTDMSRYYVPFSNENNLKHCFNLSSFCGNVLIT